MRNVLITGGAGFIGSNFIRYLLGQESDVNIVNLDCLTYAGNLGNLVDLPDAGRHTFINGNICDRELVDTLLVDHDIEFIVHFAAETHVDRSLLESETFYRTNILGTLTLLEASCQYWDGCEYKLKEDFRFHHISTDEVFGSLGVEDPHFSESSVYSPNSPYAASKAASDHLVQTFNRTYGLPTTITNSSNNYGPCQYPEKFIPLIIINALEGKTLPLYGDGLQIRDWIHVEDHCRAIWSVVQNGRIGENYLVGGKNQPTNLGIVKMICDELDSRFPESKKKPFLNSVKFVTDRPGHDRRYAVNIHKISSELGWSPEISLEQGLKKTIAWYIDHSAWVSEVKNKSDYLTWIQNNYQTRN